MSSKKLFIGPRLRRLREQHQLTQSQCAKRLGLSHSYMNQLENNQRPVTAAVLIKIANAFSTDIAQFSADSDDQLAADINLAMQDPVFNNSDVHWQDVQHFVQNQPDLASSVSRLYRQYSRLREDYEQLVNRFYGEQRTAHLSPLPHEEVRDFFYRDNNYIDVLDRAAETLFKQQHFNFEQLPAQLQQYLQQQLDISVDAHATSTTNNEAPIKHFDRSNQTLYLSTQLTQAQKNFQMANQIALTAFADQIDTLCQQGGIHNEQSRELTRIGLANYFAGALLMPYTAFLDSAEKLRYDIEALQSRFYTSTEQVCHRLSTLQRKGHNGVPFYFVRVDQAGNISKRQSATRFHFARTGGACPLWNVHEAFSSPQQVLAQIAQMPDGDMYFCVARQVTHSGGSHGVKTKRFAVGLGCELQHAHRLVYADGLDLQSKALVTPIGPGCRVCPRQHCAQRAFPPAGKNIDISCNIQYLDPYRFCE